MNTSSSPPNWWGRLLESLSQARHNAWKRKKERRTSATNSKDARKQRTKNQKRNRRQRMRAAIKPYELLIATIFMIGFSTTTALPAQVQWLQEQKLSAARAIAAAGMLEGATWFAAMLYARSVALDKPSRIFRFATLCFALVAAAINFQHGQQTGSFTMGVIYAIGSLLGMISWEGYMFLTRKSMSGMSGEELKLWTLRWCRFPRVMFQVGKIRAVHGTSLSLEEAWKWAYLRQHGTPTVPVATTHPLVTDVLNPAPKASLTDHSDHPDADDPSETSAGPDRDNENDPPIPEDYGGVALDVRDTGTFELPVNWDQIGTVADLFAEGGGTGPGTTGSDTGTDQQHDRDTARDNRRDSSTGPEMTSEVPPENGPGPPRRDAADGPVDDPDVPSQSRRDRSHQSRPQSQVESRSHRDSHEQSQSHQQEKSRPEADQSHPSPTETTHHTGTGTTTRTTGQPEGARSRKERLIERYFELEREGYNPIDTNSTAIGREIGVDRKYVKRIFAECHDNKHANPADPV